MKDTHYTKIFNSIGELINQFTKYTVRTQKKEACIVKIRAYDSIIFSFTF